MVRTCRMYLCAIVVCLYAGYAKAADNHRNDPSAATEVETSKAQTDFLHLFDERSISLDDLLKAALQYNPEIAAAQNDISAATGRLRQAGLYPNPTIEFEAEDIPAGDVDFSRNQNTVSIIQPIIIGQRRSNAVSAAAAEQESLRFVLQHTIHQVLGDIRLAYTDLVCLERALVLSGELLSDANEVLAIAQARFDASAATKSELLAAQMKSTTFELNIRNLQLKIASAAKHLQSFLPGVRVTKDRIRHELSMNLPGIDLERLLADVRRQHPLILAAEKSSEAAEYRLALAKAERLPDVSFRGAYGRDTAERENIFEVGISIPLPLFNRNQGRIAEMRHMAARSHHEARSCIARLEAEISAAQASYMTARNYVSVYRKRIVPAADTAFEHNLERYRAGRAGLPDVLNAMEELAGAKLSLLKAVRDMNKAHALLHKVAGTAMNDIQVKEQKGDLQP